MDDNRGPKAKTEISARRNIMKKTILKTLVVASVLSPAVAFAQTAKTQPTTATYITKEEVDVVSSSEQSKQVADENMKVADLGYENFTVGLIHRASTRNSAPPPPARGNAGGAAAPVETCGRHMDALPPGGTPGALVHDSQTEGYYIVSGGGTMFTGGYIVNGRHVGNNAPGGPNGPGCGGMAYDVQKVVAKPGDIVIIPAGVVHGWADIPDHVDYLSFRPSQNVLQAGWVNPMIAK
jgi:mannose-6-phosphate isomerase-like protein (cupin superfamily)